MDIPQTVTKQGTYSPQVENIQAATLDKRFGVVSGSPVTASASGDTLVYAPAAGKRTRLKWVGLSSPSANSTEVLAIVTWEAGPEIYRWAMGNPGAFAHSSVREGATNQRLMINLSGAQTVYVNIDVEEF